MKDQDYDYETTRLAREFAQEQRLEVEADIRYYRDIGLMSEDEAYELLTGEQVEPGDQEEICEFDEFSDEDFEEQDLENFEDQYFEEEFQKDLELYTKKYYPVSYYRGKFLNFLRSLKGNLQGIK